jgi:plasmid replication initiation protein
MSLTVKLHVEEDGHAIYKEFNLFESAECDQDKNDDNNSVVRLTCSETAKDFFYCLSKYHYTKYELCNIVSLVSKYSYLLYLYINAEYQKRRTNHSEWNISIKKLKEEVFDLNDQKSYREFSSFNRSVFSVALKEINEKTNYMVEYSPVKKGKTIVGVHFSCFLKDSEETLDVEVYDPSVYKNKRLRTLARICEYKFSNSQVQEIKSILDETIIPDYFIGTEEERQEDYLKDMYRQFLRLEYKFANSKKAVKNRFLYFKKMLVSEMDDFEAANIQEDDEDGDWA